LRFTATQIHPVWALTRSGAIKTAGQRSQGRWRKIQVKADLPGLHLYARSRYYAP
jgi:hypothetical protein